VPRKVQASFAQKGARAMGRMSAMSFIVNLPAAGRALLAAACLLGAAPLQATPEYVLPSLFDVAGVASDDVLNIRAAPSATAAIIGSLAHDARDIEVVGTDATGRWARVNAGEHSGWAALRYLDYQVDVWQPGALPPTLHCLGTEPFWSFRISGESLLWATPDTQESIRIRAIMDTGRFRDPRRTILARNGAEGMAAVIVPMACSDGMSDRAYGLDVTVIWERRQMLTGCCSIAP
jgi:uncharacterized membrane protein